MQIVVNRPQLFWYNEIKSGMKEMFRVVNIENELLSIAIKEKGAELDSIKLKKDDTEYLWQGDKKIWGRNAPVLFPIVGKLKDNKCEIAGKSYEMSQHGFARDMGFKLTDRKGSSAEFTLEYNEDTLKKYPFKFQLKVKYEIEDNGVKVNYTVINKDDKEMLFSIGAHPGFVCPLLKGENLDDYYLEFEKEESLDTYVLDNGLIGDGTYEFINNKNIIPLSKELFKNDAIILENFKSNSIAIKSSKNDKSVEVKFAGFPYVGIWSKADEGDFVCIEPWYGIADSVYSNGKLEDKKGIMKLMQEESFQCSFEIEIK